MENVFEITDKNKKKVYLSKERWNHIRNKHSVEDYEIIKEGLINPTDIVFFEEDIIIFYKHFKNRKEPSKFLKTIVKYLNGKGYIITSYFVRKILK